MNKPFCQGKFGVFTEVEIFVSWVWETFKDRWCENSRLFLYRNQIKKNTLRLLFKMFSPPLWRNTCYERKNWISNLKKTCAMKTNVFTVRAKAEIGTATLTDLLCSLTGLMTPLLKGLKDLILPTPAQADTVTHLLKDNMGMTDS